MKKLHVFGCSFAYGEIETSTALEKYPDIKITLKKTSPYAQNIMYDCVTPGHFDTDNDYKYYVEKCRTESFAYLMAKEFGYDTINYAVPGCSNKKQLYSLLRAIANDKIKSNDCVLFCFTSSARDNEYKYMYIDASEKHLKRNMFLILDYIKVLYILSQIEKIYKIKILKLNAFTDHLLNYYFLEQDGKDVINVLGKIEPKYYVGWKKYSNTLMDILIDNFDSNDETKSITYFSNKILNDFEDHNIFDIKKYFKYCSDTYNDWKKYEKYFQPRLHPSKSGNKKIANFLIQYVSTNFPDFFADNGPKTDFFIYK